MKIELTPIGTVSLKGEPHIALDKEHAAGLEGLDGFSHIQVLWYAHEAPEWDSEYLTVAKPYRKAPDTLGIFSTRSPYRPNSIGLSVVQITGVDVKAGTIGITWMDALDGTPVLDIKPYHPSADRVRDLELPSWCDYWPQSLEESGDFPWDEEFTFQQ